MKLKAALAGKNVFDKFGGVAQKLRPRVRTTETLIYGRGGGGLARRSRLSALFPRNIVGFFPSEIKINRAAVSEN